jgi:hypothetical protein
LSLAKSAVVADESPAAATPAATDSQTPAETPAPAKAAVADPNLPAADEILNQLRSKLEGLDSLRCELHQTSLISGMKLTARGKVSGSIREPREPGVHDLSDGG